jgi:hypothetical protein
MEASSKFIIRFFLETDVIPFLPAQESWARSFGATLVVLVTIVMTMILIRTLGQASQGLRQPFRRSSC